MKDFLKIVLILVIIFGMFSSIFEFRSFSENPWARDAWLACPPASAHDNGEEFLQFSKVWVLTGEISVSAVKSTWVTTGFSFFFSALLGLTDAGTEQKFELDSCVSGPQPVTASCEHTNEPLGSIKGHNFLTTWATTRFSISTALHRLNQSICQSVSQSGTHVYLPNAILCRLFVWRLL